MEADFKKTLIDFLEIIHYEGDKDVFIKEFVESCEALAGLEMIKKLPENEQKIIKDNFGKNSNEVDEIIKKYVNQKGYEIAVEEASKKIFQKYLENILPELTDDEKKKLAEWQF